MNLPYKLSLFWEIQFSEKEIGQPEFSLRIGKFKIPIPKFLHRYFS